MAVQNGAYTRTMGFSPDQAQVHPIFHMEAVEDPAASAREGRAIYKNEERVEIVMPGNPYTRPVVKVTDEHRQRWPEQYEAFKKGLDVAVNGTPLEMWARLKKAQILELKHLGFVTVEDVANMNDLATQKIGMGGLGLRQAAKAFLDDAERDAVIARAQAEAAARKAENDEMKGKIEELRLLCDDLFKQVQAFKNAPNPLISTPPFQMESISPTTSNLSESPVESSLAGFDVNPRRTKHGKADHKGS